MRQNGFQMKDHYWHATQMKERKVISWRVKFKASDWSILFCMWRHIFSFDDQRKKWSPARPTFCNRAQRVKNEDKSLIFDKMKWRKSFGTLREYKWSPRVNLVFAASRSSNIIKGEFASCRIPTLTSNETNEMGLKKITWVHMALNKWKNN